MRRCQNGFLDAVYLYNFTQIHKRCHNSQWHICLGCCMACDTQMCIYIHWNVIKYATACFSWNSSLKIKANSFRARSRFSLFFCIHIPPFENFQFEILWKCVDSKIYFTNTKNHSNNCLTLFCRNQHQCYFWLKITFSYLLVVIIR